MIRFSYILFFVFSMNTSLGQNRETSHFGLPSCSQVIINEDINPDMSTNMDGMLVDHSRNIQELEHVYCLAKQTGNIKLEALSLYKLAKFLSMRSDVYSSKRVLLYLDKSIELSKHHNFSEIYLAAKEVQCTVFTNYGLLDNANTYANEFLAAAQKQKDTPRIAEGHMMLGRLKREQNSFAESEEHLKKAIAHVQDNSYVSKKTLCYTYLHLSYLRRSQGKFAEAIMYAEQGLSHSTDLGLLYENVIKSMMTIAITINRIDLGHHKNNIAALESVKETAPKYTFLSSEYYYVYALQLEKEGRIDEAIEYYLKSISSSHKDMTFLNISKAYKRVVPLLEKKNEETPASLAIVKHSEAIFQEEVLKYRTEYLFKEVFLELEKEKEKAEIIVSKLTISKKIVLLSSIAIIIFSLFTYSLYKRYKLKARLNNEITLLNKELKSNVHQLTKRTNSLHLTNEKLENLAEKHQKLIGRLKEFNPILSHDFKSPAASIAAFGEILKNSKSVNFLKQEEKELINHIVSSSYNLLKFTKKLKDYNTHTLQIAGEFTSIDLNEVIKVVLDGLYNKITTSSAKIILLKNLPTINGNKVLLVKLFQDLITDFLHANKVDLNPVVEIDTQFIDQSIIITINDGVTKTINKNGDTLLSSMNKEAPILAVEGLEARLSTYKEIMQLHYGEVFFSSKKGQGTLFYLIFPMFTSDF